jgi:hypothetical protein
MTDLYADAASKIIAQNIMETEAKIILDVISRAGLTAEFYEFCRQNPTMLLFDVAREFALLHPDKFVVTCPTCKNETVACTCMGEIPESPE